MSAGVRTASAPDVRGSARARTHSTKCSRSCRNPSLSATCAQPMWTGVISVTRATPSGAYSVVVNGRAGAAPSG